MKWSDTVASRCRWADAAIKNWGAWDIVWEDSESDYQGHAAILAAEPDGEHWEFYEWTYGSCSGCDSWEGTEYEDRDVLAAEMKKNAARFDKGSLWAYGCGLTNTSGNSRLADAIKALILQQKANYAPCPHCNGSGFVQGKVTR